MRSGMADEVSLTHQPARSELRQSSPGAALSRIWDPQGCGEQFSEKLGCCHHKESIKRTQCSSVRGRLRAEAETDCHLSEAVKSTVCGGQGAKMMMMFFLCFC